MTLSMLMLTLKVLNARVAMLLVLPLQIEFLTTQ